MPRAAWPRAALRAACRRERSLRIHRHAERRAAGPTILFRRRGIEIAPWRPFLSHVIPLGTRGLLGVIAVSAAPARTASHVCFLHAFDQRGPLLDQRGSCACESAGRGRYLLERGPAGFPVIAVLPSMFVTATFCRRVVSWRGVLFGHNRTRPPPYMGWRGPCSACLTRLASFPAHPVPAADRQGRVSARSASFPAPPTSPESPPGGARFRR